MALRGLAGDSIDERVGDFADDVNRLPFFNEFTSDQVREIVSASNIVTISEGQIVVAEGEIDDTFYILVSGKAKVRKNGRDIASIGTGECFGEMACIGGQARVATVVADTDCILMKISATLLDRSSDSIKFLFFKNFAMTFALIPLFWYLLFYPFQLKAVLGNSQRAGCLYPPIQAKESILEEAQALN
ncbi:MAG: cyclic nucleotide-binding domain-containing protein [Deltaproteobacteria bacterium]|nr:cyclic nucleotide-binding domain-containing protein [Deltaproteobacteria bacterium]